MNREAEIVNDWCLDISKSLGLPVITGKKTHLGKVGNRQIAVDGYIPKFPKCIFEFTTRSVRVLSSKFEQIMQLKEIYNVEYAFLISISKGNKGEKEQILWESWLREQSSNMENTVKFYNCELEKGEVIADITDFVRRNQKIIHRKISVSEFNVGNIKFQRKPHKETIEKMKKSIQEFDFEWPPTFNHVSVVFNENGKFDIIDGQMRILAMKELGLNDKKVPVIIVQSINQAIDMFQSINLTGQKLTGIDRLEISLERLKEGTSPKYFKDIDNEFKKFKDEYKEEHYTSCCLRLGRLIECITASTSEELNVQMKQYNVKNLEKMMEEILNETRTYEPESTLIDKKNKIISLLHNLNEKYEVFFKENIEAREETTDWSPRIFLKQIRRRYESNIEINRKFTGKKSINSDLEKVWRLRNKASHFQKSKQDSEMSRKEVDDALKNLYDFCDKLHDIIIESRK